MKKTILSSLLALTILLISSCGKRETAVEAGNRDGVLILGNGSEPKSLDPHIVTGVLEHNILSALLEGLVAEDPKTLQPVPGVAESWDVSTDGKTYTFHLRKTAKWSNGDSVTANDFVFSFRRLLSPNLAAEYAYMLYPLKNAKAFNTGKISDFSQVGVKAVDPQTLTLELENAIPYFLELLNHYSWWPVHPATILKFGEIDDPNSPWTRPENFVGNGPFTLKSWEINREITVVKNPTYWDAKTVKLNAIRFLPIDSVDTEERAFRDGRLHLTSSIPLHRIDAYRRDNPDLIRFDTYFGTYFYRFNCTRGPLKDARVRRALSMGIRRQQITEYILKGGQAPAFFLTPPDTGSWYTCNSPFTDDLDEARKLLADAGYPGGKGLPSLRLLYNTSESHRTIAEAIQQMWKTELGVEITLENQEWKVYLDSVKRADYDIARASWIGDYNDPNTFLDMWVTDGGNNRTGWSNPDYDRLLQTAASSPNREARAQAFQQAEALLMREMPIAPIYFYVRSMLIRPSVQGWYPNILDHHPYKHVSLKTGPE